MLNFLLDITPDKSQLLITIKLAGILREKKQEVYYTYTSNPAFTPVLYNKGISNCVLYPDDFRWLKPDLTLLDCRHAAHASLYRQLAIDYIFIAMQLPDQKNIQDKDISILYLPPTPYLSSDSGPRLETLTKRLQDIKKDKERNIIVGLLGKGSINTLLLSVITSSNSSAVRRNSFSAFKSIITGFAPARIAHGSYETYEGCGIITSSPGLIIALKPISIASEPPTVTITSSAGLYTIPCFLFW